MKRCQNRFEKGSKFPYLFFIVYRFLLGIRKA